MRSPHPQVVGLLVIAAVAAACSFSRAPGLNPPPGAPIQSPPPEASPPGATAAALASPQASSTPPPTLTPTASPTPAPTIRQLTTDGCCTGPFWSPDGSKVLYIDRPAPDAPVGFWGVSLDGGPPELFTDQLGVFSPGWQLRAFPQNGVTIVESVADGAQWTVANGGRVVQFAPDGERLAWTAGQSGPPFDTARREVWVSRVDGQEARAAITVYGGGLVDWLPDGRLLVSGRLSLTEENRALWVISLEGGAPLELLRAPRLRGISPSPQGGWLAFQVTFSAVPDENGLWILHLASGARTRLDHFGAFRWRSEGHLLVIPLEMDVPSHQLWEVDAASGQAMPLTDPADTPLKVANGDWSVSPNGGHIAFVSALDHNIWVLSLNR